MKTFFLLLLFPALLLAGCVFQPVGEQQPTASPSIQATPSPTGISEELPPMPPGETVTPTAQAATSQARGNEELPPLPESSSSTGGEEAPPLPA